MSELGDGIPTRRRYFVKIEARREVSQNMTNYEELIGENDV